MRYFRSNQYEHRVLSPAICSLCLNSKFSQVHPRRMTDRLLPRNRGVRRTQQRHKRDKNHIYFVNYVSVWICGRFQSPFWRPIGYSVKKHGRCTDLGAVRWPFAGIPMHPSGGPKRTATGPSCASPGRSFSEIEKPALSLLMVG